MNDYVKAGLAGGTITYFISRIPIIGPIIVFLMNACLMVLGLGVALIVLLCLLAVCL